MKKSSSLISSYVLYTHIVCIIIKKTLTLDKANQFSSKSAQEKQDAFINDTVISISIVTIQIKWDIHYMI